MRKRTRGGNGYGIGEAIKPNEKRVEIYARNGKTQKQKTFRRDYVKCVKRTERERERVALMRKRGRHRNHLTHFKDTCSLRKDIRSIKEYGVTQHWLVTVF